MKYVVLLLLLLLPLQSKHFARTLRQTGFYDTDGELDADHPGDVDRPRILTTVTRGAMRVTTNTSTLNTAVAPTTTASLDFIKNSVSVIQQFVNLRFKVYNEQGNIIAPTTCVDYSSPSVDVANGIANSDLHLYVIYESNTSKNYAVTGKYCQTAAGVGGLPDPTLARGRPTFGRLKFNTAYNLDGATLTNRLFAQLASSTLRQVFHIMGFDSSLYNTYLDENTQNVYSTAVLQTATGLHASRSTTKMITTSNVVTWARSWFDCNSINGMLVQNEGTDGEETEWATSTGSHWDRTLMYDQLMTRTPLSAQRGVSGLTYALFKDMGWYTVDDSFNDTSPYGYKKGCEFFFNSCNSSTSFSEFCSSSTTTRSCTSQSFSKGRCQINTYSDRCGIWIDSLNCVDPDSPSDGYKNLCQEQYGVSSFCVTSTIATVSVDNTLQSRCYPYVCHDNNNITFTIGANKIYCAPVDAGKNKTLSGYFGTLLCPSYETFCKMSRKTCPNWCNKRGICTRGICHCMSGYSGEDCSISTCLTNQYYDVTDQLCKGVCPTGTMANVFNRFCQSCINCTECTREPTICSACVGGSQKQYENVCYDACPSRTYASGDVCYNCSSSCGNCSGASAASCTSCTGGLYLSNPAGGSCGSTCPDSNYDVYDTINFICVANCPVYLKLDSGQCVRCPSGQYKNTTNNICTLTCPDGSYANTLLQYCSSCNSVCLTCAGPEKRNCLSCPTSGTTLNFLLLGMCVASTDCPRGTYADQSSWQCRSCPSASNCSACTNSSGNIVCSDCKYGTFMTTSGTCSTTCAANQYRNSANSSCVDCHSLCATCSSHTNNSCLTCPSGKYILTNSTGGYCLDGCPSTLYFSEYITVGRCLSCYATCLTCSGTLRTNCLTCIPNMFLSSGTCYYACPLGTYRNTANQECSDCDLKCAACTGPSASNCTKCQTGYVLDNTTCTSSCPTGQTNNTYGVCTKAALRVLALCLILALLI